MKFHIVDDDEDSESERVDASQHKRANGFRSAPPVAVKPKPRFRAPSVDSSTESSDDESKSHDDDDDDDGARVLGVALSSMDIALLTKKSRQELLEQVERTCEIKAVNAVNSSPAYQVLCETLQKARTEAESKLKRVDATQHHDAVFQSMLQKNTEAENQSLRVLSQRRGRERSVLNEVEQELIQYQKELAEETRAQAEAREREEAARQRLEEARQKKLQDEQAKQAALEAKQAAQKAKEAALEAAEARRKDEEKKAKEDADARQQQEDEQKQKAIKAKQEADRAAKQYIQDAKARMERLDAIQEQSKRILDNPDPAVKQTRVDIRLKAGACNQISAAPSAIKSVVTKIQNLLQTAKASGDAYFKYAMDMVATNLSKQARVVLDYKACYPVAHVIVMSCVHTPELTDVILANFHKMCVFTIPDNPSKKADQSVADYKRALGFEDAIGDTSDKDGLEHVTVYTKRMTMIVAVLAAAMQTAPYDGSPQPAGLSIGDCWVWTARLVNETPHLMTGSLLLTILEVAGFELLRHYKNQFHKLLVLIARDVCPRLSKDAKTGAANAAGQLEIFVSQYQANGCRLNEPEGRKLEETKLTAADEEKTDNDNGDGRGYNNNYGNNFGGGGGRGRGRGRGRGGGRGGRGW